MMILECALILLVLLPVVTLVHELSHLFVAKIFGAELVTLKLGSGPSLLKIGKLDVRNKYFMSGSVQYRNLQRPHIIKRVLVNLGGPLINLVIAGIIYHVGKSYVFHSFIQNIVLNDLLILSVGSAFVTLLPININGKAMDGRRLYHLFKYGTETKLSSKICK